MNYEKHYNLLIARGKRTLIHGYRERHHCIPKCMGGDDSEENLVYLTAREHFVAHQLLVKMYPGNRKLIFAFQAMSMNGKGQNRTNRLYSWIKEMMSEARSAEYTGRKLSPESVAKREATRKEKGVVNIGMKGKTHTDEWKQAASIRESTRPRKPFTAEARLKMSISAKNRKKA